jgi:pyridinium-3,5-bisthiocarboxylic acid mononucleotide nickel chelatase
MTRTAMHIDAQAGASGDMFLGAVVDLGADPDEVGAALRRLAPDLGDIAAEKVRRAGLRATQCRVRGPAAPGPERHLGDILALLTTSELPGPVVARGVDVFETLAEAEALAHGCAPEDVHFHEVGAWDSIADVVGTLLGLHLLGLLDADISVGRVAVGSGTTATEHGALPVPAPATLAILTAAGAEVTAGPARHEACTPTGAALLATLAGSWTELPPMVVRRVGVGAGGQDTPEGPNVLRLVVGAPREAAGPRSDLLLLEATVDDLDPRVWPHVLDRLVTAGARDAWLTPVVMRKGRPGHVVTALVPAEAAARVEAMLFAETPTLGVRHVPTTRTTLPRRTVDVHLDGQTVSVKIGFAGDQIMTVQPELADAERAADATGRPLRDVLALAAELARAALARPPH